MSMLRYSVSISLDGFVAGANQGPDHPLGDGGERLHQWMRGLAVWRQQAGLEGGETNASTAVLEEEDRNIGAIIMGRNMFGGTGDWGDGSWRGWWGANPPFHMPVFVVTHHARPVLVMDGGTTFTFVEGGILAALDLAREAAHGADVALSGGAGTAKQYLVAGLVDEVALHLVPTFLGEGVRLFDDPRLRDVSFEILRVVAAPDVTHLTYRVGS